jgi:hypothetical protein
VSSCEDHGKRRESRESFWAGHTRRVAGEVAMSGQSRARFWEVGRMIKAFGAPIEDADAKTIADYLKTNYGGP